MLYLKYVRINAHTSAMAHKIGSLANITNMSASGELEQRQAVAPSVGHDSKIPLGINGASSGRGELACPLICSDGLDLVFWWQHAMHWEWRRDIRQQGHCCCSS
jgi:hypothetical protein